MDVVVVGGGIAGLYAAHLLHQAGLGVTLLEAQGLVGGRTYHREGFFPWPVDLGGEFIHGEKTLFKRFCDTHGISTVRTFSSFPPVGEYFADGRPVQEFIWLGQESRLLDWVEAQRQDPDVAHLLRVLTSLGPHTQHHVSACH